MKKRVLVLLLIILQAVTAVNTSADGVLPKAESVFGEYMPLASNAFGRVADSEEMSATTWQETYQNVTEEEYSILRSYLDYKGYKVKKTEKDQSSVTITLENGKNQILLLFIWDTRTLTMVYPSGTRPETAGTYKTDKINIIEKSILPSLEEIFVPELPSIAVAISRKPDQINTDEAGSVHQIYRFFSDDDYQSFSSYLLNNGAEVVNYTIDGNSMVIELEKDGRTFEMIYDRDGHTATEIYPLGTRAEKYVEKKDNTGKTYSTSQNHNLLDNDSIFYPDNDYSVFIIEATESYTFSVD